PFFTLPKLLLRLAPLRDILANLQEPVSEGPHHPFDEYPRPVLAHVPAHVGGRPILPGDKALLLWSAGGPVLGSEGYRHVLADGLRGGPAEYRLRAGGPTRDQPAGVGGQDRVVPRGLDDEPGPLLADAHRLLGVPALGHVPQDLGIACNPAVGITQRRDD